MTERNDIKEHAIAFLNFYCNGDSSQFAQQWDKMFDAYWKSVQPPSGIVADLSDLTRKVSENEAAFLARFLPVGAIGVENFYISPGCCFVEYINEVEELYETVPTADFLEWAANYD
jgi:hypothetical protein